MYCYSTSVPAQKIPSNPKLRIEGKDAKIDPVKPSFFYLAGCLFVITDARSHLSGNAVSYKSLTAEYAQRMEVNE